MAGPAVDVTNAMVNRSEGPAIGIDLGSTYSCVAVWRHGKVEIIVNGQGNRTTPSCVAFTDSDRLVGEAAFNQSARNPSNTIFHAKRLIGRRFSDPVVQSDIELWPFKVVEDGGDQPKFAVSLKGEDKRFSAEEISSMVLSSMREIAETQLGTSVKKAVITVPAYFNNSQRQATKDAGAAAGLSVLRVINEPMAAAMAYGLNRRPRGDGSKKTILVFDLGGGTLDISLLSMDGSELKVIATTGDSHLGGADFDQRLLEFCCDEFSRKHREDVRANPRALRRLRTACEMAKRTLSYMVETTIEVEYLHNGIDFQCTITAAKFEDLNMDLFLKCMELVEVCLKDSNIEKEAVDDVLLVGGSSRIPKIQELLQDLFQGTAKMRKEANPDEAVAVGAAIHAAMRGGDETQSIEDLLLTDVIPLSLGVNTVNGLMSVLIPRNTPIPATKEKLFTTSFDDQTAIRFNIFEGERALSLQNNHLARFDLVEIDPAPTGVPRILVRFQIDEDGILTVSAQDKNTKGKADIIVTKYGSASRGTEEIKRMLEDGRKNKEKDEEIRRRRTPPPTPANAYGTKRPSANAFRTGRPPSHPTDPFSTRRPPSPPANAHGTKREGELNQGRKEETKQVDAGGGSEPPVVQHPHNSKRRALMELLCLRNK